MASLKIIDLGHGFWNIRGSFRLAGLVDIGNQISLVQRTSGNFVFLDSYALDGETQAWVQRTIAGAPIEAIVHLHPFHTVHTRRMHALYPRAKLYGTARHHERFSELPWEPERTEEARFHELMHDDFHFFVPRGVDFIPKNQNLHFASVLALHHASQTLHVDDTLICAQLPKPLSRIKRDIVRFHPTLSQVLEKRPGAAAQFRTWAMELTAMPIQQLAAAHSATLSLKKAGEDQVKGHIKNAVAKVEKILNTHTRKYG